MQALLDGDILSYEIPFAAQFSWNQDLVVKEDVPFEYVCRLLTNRIEHICEKVEATMPPKLYLTGKNNFRDSIAKSKPYKGTRQHEYPLHYHQLREYMLAYYDTILVDGMEADDAMAIEQTSRLEKRDTVICSRDKDLRMVEGYQYSWAIARQDEKPMEWVDELGYIYLDPKGKLNGAGTKFFYAQMLTGDVVDNIGGLPRIGAKKAYKELHELESVEDCFRAVKAMYKQKVGGLWELYMLEQGRLLWMCREMKDGEPVLWEIPQYEYLQEQEPSV